MHVTSLRVFVDRLSEAQRLGFGDLRRLQRDILPNGPQSREDVEALLALDLALERADRGWPEYLVEAVKGFVIAASNPQGVVDPELGDWLVSVLSETQPKTAQRVARAVVSEAVEVDDALRAFAKMSAKRKPKGAASSALLLSGGLSYTWPGVRVGGPVLTVRLETGSLTALAYLVRAGLRCVSGPHHQSN